MKQIITLIFFSPILPEFPGGTKKMHKFMNDNFQLPKEAEENNESGTVWIDFVVYADGYIGNIEIFKGA